MFKLLQNIMEMAQLIHPPPQSGGEALLLGATCSAGCRLRCGSRGCCSPSSLLRLLAPAGLGPRSAASLSGRISATLFGVSHLQLSHTAQHVVTRMWKRGLGEACSKSAMPLQKPLRAAASAAHVCLQEAN